MITILTPTYNRKAKLSNLYESLKRQINKNFVWYIIDDGSTDGTDKLIKRFQKEKLMTIRYDKKRNGGKHTAINYAVRKIDTELTMIVDSDDLLTPDAVETIFNDWLENSERGIGGMIYLKGYSGIEPIGDKWPYDEQFGNTITHTVNKGIKGDKAEVFRTDILKEYPFPEFKGEKFLSENIVWLNIAKKYNVFMKNKIIYIAEYLEGGLSRSGRTMQISNPIGAMENAKMCLDSRFSVKIRMKNALLYNCYGFFSHTAFGKMWKESPNKFFTTLAYLPGFVLYRYWKKKYS